MINRNVLKNTKWTIKTLGEVSVFLDHLRKPITKSDRIEGEYNYYGANGKQGTINDYIFDYPTILLAEDGGNFGNFDRTIAYKVDGKYWVNNHAHVIKPNEEIINFDFLLRVLEKYDVRPFINGATRQKLNKSDALLLEIPFPPLPEQQRIADILDKAEAINQKREQALALCDEFLRATFLDMFGDPVSNPKGWVYEKLDEVILSIKAGKSLAGDSKPANENELGVLKVSAVSYGFFQPQENKKIEKLVDREKLIFPKKGDFLFSRANTRELVGATCIVQDDFGHVFLPDKLWLIDVDSEKVSAYYLHFLMLEPKFKDKLTSQATGTSGSMLNISQKKFVNTIAPIPPIELQQKFSSIVEKVNAIKARIQHAQELPLFEALSQQAFKGELTL